MGFIGVEVEQESSAPPPKINRGSAPTLPTHRLSLFRKEGGTSSKTQWSQK